MDILRACFVQFVDNLGACLIRIFFPWNPGPGIWQIWCQANSHRNSNFGKCRGNHRELPLQIR